LIDITTKLDEFADRALDWSESRSQAALNRLAISLNGHADWDFEAGEEWGRVLIDRSVHAFVSMCGPLAFVLTSDQHIAADNIGDEFLLVTVRSMDSDEIVAQDRALVRAFGTRVERLPGGLQPFSVGDLWYTTV
jgi:hypothetical protein